ncbi:MAG: HTH domain-containing protein [Patescibacteria group bacterium]|nr:HTH domain-containing protein [Patescibacteria group bacterium]
MVVTNSSTIDLKNIASEIFKVLTEKEQAVISQRFNLNGKGKRTLNYIGQQYTVTRERIRQIEAVALVKLRRTMKNTQIKSIVDIAHNVLREHGGLLIESKLVSAVLQRIGGQISDIDGNFIRVALTVDGDTRQIFDRMRVRTCWSFNEIDKKLVLRIGDAVVTVLKKNKDAMSADKLISGVVKFLAERKIQVESQLITSAVDVDTRLATLDGKVGLMEWRSIHPRALRDKAYIVLKRANKPMHFTEITNTIIAANFDRKAVRNPAVHNELIRSEKFVLVGRGLYGLREWGPEGGIVPDVLARIVKNAKKPLTRDEIIEATLLQRSVKEATVMLNLQKHKNIKKNPDNTYSWKD